MLKKVKMKYGVVWCSVGFIFGLSLAYPLLSKRQNL